MSERNANVNLLLSAGTIGAVGILAYLSHESTICLILTFVLLVVLSCILGILLALLVYVKFSTKHKTGAGIERIKNEISMYNSYFLNENVETISPTKHQKFPVVFGRTVDIVAQQILDFILRDYVHVWLKNYAYKSEDLIDNMKEDLWYAIQCVHVRLRRMDYTKLIAVDVISKITGHFEKIRISQTLVINTNRPPIFQLSPYLMTSEKELEYLRRISKLLVRFLLPRGYSQTPTVHLMQEIIACKILQPIINSLTEPDYINQKIVEYIESQHATADLHRKTFEYANSFEDFLKLIHATKDVDGLKRIRYNIMTEIMQATTIQNLNRAKGVDPDLIPRQSGTPAIGKSDMIAARKLKRYINQLTYAKEHCEKQLMTLGWNASLVHDQTNETLPLSAVLDSVVGRRFLSLFLETLASQGLVGYWLAVEELRTAPRADWHQLGAEIFYTFIRSPCEVKIDKNVRKRMEGFLLGDQGPEVFYEVQQMVLKTLQDKYYQPFTMSTYYKQMIETMSVTEVEDDGRPVNTASDEVEGSETPITNVLAVGDHSNYVKKKLNQLQERLSNKTQALQALRSSLKPGSKVLTILEREVEWLKGEKWQLESHIMRTETWSANLGKWRAVVQSADVPDDKEPQFVIIVHMVNEEEGLEDLSTGWVVLRTLTHFQELHRKLTPLCSSVRALELPSNTFKFLFGNKLDRNSLEKAKGQIQTYLQFILEDDKINQCEAVYSFLSPSSDHLKYATNMPTKKSKFSFSTLFKSGEQTRANENSSVPFRDNEDDDISHYLDTPGLGDNFPNKFNEVDGNKDQIAEPLYALMGEIFDMRGVFKFLRRSLITFVQITYGRTISRQIRETIEWCFTESMLHYYLMLFTKSWWPGGELAPTGAARTREQKLETAMLARKLFVGNVPDVLVNLVGSQTARRGALKVFEVVQNQKMNKQLLYEIMEIFVLESFPEIKNN